MIYVACRPSDAAILPLLQKHFDAAGQQFYAPGQDNWTPEDEAALKDCQALIAVVSPASMAAVHLTYEWATAAALGRPVIVLTLRRAELHPRLAQMPHISFEKGPDWASLDRLLQELELEGSASMAAAAAVEPVPQSVPAIITELPTDTPAPIRQAYEAFDSFDPEERETAFRNLLRMDHPAASDALALAMKNPSKDIRWKAARALAEKNDPRAVDGLLEMLSAGDEQTGWDAAWALVRIGGLAAAPGILEQLRKNNTNARKSATWALGQIGLPIKGLLLDAIGDPEEAVRLGVGEALREIGPVVVPDLLAVLKEEDEARRMASLRLLKLIQGGMPAVPGLVTLLREETDARRLAGIALVELGDKSVPELARALRDPDKRVAKAAGQLLLKIGTPTALEVLKG